jgi:hypothetical protein
VQSSCRPALSFLAVGLSRTEPVFLSSRATWAGLGNHGRAPLSPMTLMTWPRCQPFLLPSIMTEPESNATANKSTEETGISYPLTSRWRL